MKVRLRRYGHLHHRSEVSNSIDRAVFSAAHPPAHPAVQESDQPSTHHAKKRVKFSRYLRLLREEDGSASVELVIFAMPLFIPLLMLASHAMALSSSKIETSHLARTALRAFVTAPSTPLGHARVQQVLQVSEASSSVPSGQFQENGLRLPRYSSSSTSSTRLNSTQRYTYLIECRRQPCIQPSNRIRITIRDERLGVDVAATLYTDQWIQGEPGFTAEERNLVFGYRDVADIEEEISPLIEAKEFVDQIREVLNALPGR
jgi:hypothetical protein